MGSSPSGLQRLIAALGAATARTGGDGLVVLASTIGSVEAGIVPALEEGFEQETGIQV